MGIFRSRGLRWDSGLISNKRIAIIGAGFAGLSLAYYLLEGCARLKVVVFDAVGIGGGASGVATGLLHPYPGEMGRRSQEATQALLATSELIATVEQSTSSLIAMREGILRIAQTEAQQETFCHHAHVHGDVERLSKNQFLITSGMTVDCPAYLQGLAHLIQQKGGEIVIRSLQTLQELDQYDKVVLAAGAGSLQFAETAQLPLKTTKGQLLLVRSSHAYPYSMLGKGYLAKTFTPFQYILGSTYERSWTDSAPNLSIAKELILPNARTYLPSVDQMEILQCRSGIRIAPQGHYFPLIRSISNKCWLFTGMGSRGLLYHAMLAQRLCSKIFID